MYAVYITNYLLNKQINCYKLVECFELTCRRILIPINIQYIYIYRYCIVPTHFNTTHYINIAWNYVKISTQLFVI